MNVDSLVAQFERIANAPDGIAQFRRFILDLAVRGKLVPQDSFDEPASELLKSIARAKAQSAERRGGQQVEIHSIAASNALFAVAPSRSWVRFGDITTSRDGERVPVSKDERTKRAKVYDYYGASGIIDKIDSYLFDKPLLLVGEDGANLVNRSTPMAFIARGKYWVNNYAHVIDGLSEEFLRYLELYINATNLKPYITGAAPLREQGRILAKVDELMALTDTFLLTAFRVAPRAASRLTDTRHLPTH